MTLKRFRGRLSPQEIADGMNAAKRNAERLVSDAKWLVDGERFPSAASLAILAIEEMEKINLLRLLAIAADDELEKYWREIRSHRAKNVQAIFLDLVAGGARKLSDFASIYDPASEHGAIIESVKQLGFYTDYYAGGHWSDPQKGIERELADRLVRTAEALCSSKRESTTREVELWIEQVGPYWRREDFKEAVMRFNLALAREGLCSATEDETERFYAGPLTDSPTVN